MHVDLNELSGFPRSLSVLFSETRPVKSSRFIHSYYSDYNVTEFGKAYKKRYYFSSSYFTDRRQSKIVM